MRFLLFLPLPFFVVEATSTDSFSCAGTWVHHQQGFTWRELLRYGLDRRLKVSPAPTFSQPAVDGTVVGHYKGKTYKMAADDHPKFLDEACVDFFFLLAPFHF